MRPYRTLLLGLSAALFGTAALCQPSSDPTPVRSVEADPAKLAYVMVFVSDMKRSVAFYRDQLGLKLRFSSTGWSEFATGDTILALHPAGPDNAAGTSEVGFAVQDLNAFYAARRAAGVGFVSPPTPQSYGAPLAEMRDPDGARISVGGR